VHLATLAACWRLDPSDVDVAAYWLAEQALPALHTCQHLHGGIGVDESYPLHRHYAWGKDLARFVGGVEHRLEAVACTSS
jgi:alkylation response protein AidB-like acyl-CoA dehydrogenase